ncbi:MAG: hypothetical protein IKF01_03635 [Bacilli bacterium]|nr:hypothetical protein [Bacilli bacterium]
MKDYKKILEFKYKSQTYIMYLDENNKKYFLKEDFNGHLNYLTDIELAELTLFFLDVPEIMSIERISKDRLKINPKVLSKGIVVSLTLSALLSGINQLDLKSNNTFSNPVVTEYLNDKYQFKNSISLSDTEEYSDIDTYKKNGTTFEIYDMNYLDQVMQKEEITLDLLIDATKNNNSIPEKFKEIIYEYCKSLTNKYKNIDLRVFYNNLKSLKIKTCSKEDIQRKSGSEDSYGCYMKNTNEIYVIEDMDYKYNPWAHQVLYHELSHCLRNGNYEINGIKVIIKPEGPNFNNRITSEALNSLFAISLFDYEEDDIAYQLQSNYYKVILECLDNYDLSDYVNHSLSYFTSKLDEYNDDERDAAIILELIQTQYKDYYSNLLEVEPSQYYPLYDYLSSMYFKKYITDNMNYTEMKSIADELVSKITHYVPEGYNIDTDRFYKNLDFYINQSKKNR